MDWDKAEQMLIEMSLIYNKDNMRKITYNREVFPLAFRYHTGERTDTLFKSIEGIYKELVFKSI